MSRGHCTRDHPKRQAELDRLAESYVQNAHIRKPPVDPMVWCGDRNQIRVHSMDLRGECDGLLLFQKGKFHLFYQPDPNRGRFTLAHEVGHYLIEEHHQAIRFGGLQQNCKTGFLDDSPMEKEADWFASGLLMPTYLFRPRCPDPNFEDIKRAAQDFDVSWTAAVLRTIFFTNLRTGIVATVAGKIRWYHVSEAMAWSGIHSAKIGEAPPRKSRTAGIIPELKDLPCEPLGEEKTFASDWFNAVQNDPVLWEEVLPFARYDLILTLLTFEDD